MENNKIVIIGLLVVIIILLAGFLVLMPSMNKQDDADITNDTISDEKNSVTPDTITVELPEYDKTYTETVGEYTVEAEKWMGGSVVDLRCTYIKTVNQFTKTLICPVPISTWMVSGNGVNGAMVKMIMMGITDIR